MELIRSEHGQGVWALVDNMVILKTAHSQKATQARNHCQNLLYELSNEQRPEVGQGNGLTVAAKIGISVLGNRRRAGDLFYMYLLAWRNQC